MTPKEKGQKAVKDAIQFVQEHRQGSGLGAATCSLRESIEDELRDLWQWGYDREPREESVRPRLDAIMQLIEANAEVSDRDKL